jgi:glutathione synthase/RimK-type ligase-like ATP-grasp enzyme
MTIDRAACKPLQLRVARTVGMRVPDTYYGNSPREISQFALGRRIVVKPIRETGYADDGVFHAFYTAEVDGAALESDVRALSETINFVQVMVPKREELRITWVDGRCLAARIHSQIGPEEAKLDWRKVHWQELDYSKAELPESLVDSISQYCHSLDLRFGAFDFVVTPEGHYVFLECNPNGQWLWLDERADMGIAAAIANALTAHTI